MLAPFLTMPNNERLIEVFTGLRLLLARPENDFEWSSWLDQGQALGEIDVILNHLKAGKDSSQIFFGVIFAPTGPAQEVSLSSGWGDEFCALADRFDQAMAETD